MLLDHNHTSSPLRTTSVSARSPTRLTRAFRSVPYQTRAVCEPVTSDCSEVLAARDGRELGQAQLGRLDDRPGQLPLRRLREVDEQLRGRLGRQLRGGVRVAGGQGDAGADRDDRADGHRPAQGGGSQEPWGAGGVGGSFLPPVPSVPSIAMLRVCAIPAEDTLRR